MQCCCNDHLQVEDRHDVQSQMSKIAMRAATQKRYTGEQERVARMKDCSTSEHFSCLTFRTLSSLHSLRAHTLLAQSPELNLWFMILLNSVVLVTHPCIACSNVLNKARRISAFEQTIFFLEIFSASRLHSLLCCTSNWLMNFFSMGIPSWRSIIPHILTHEIEMCRWLRWKCDYKKVA